MEINTVTITLEEYRRLLQRDTILDLIVLDEKKMNYMDNNDVLRYFGTTKEEEAAKRAALEKEDF